MIRWTPAQGTPLRTAKWSSRACSAAGAGLHLIHHLINLGYSQTAAARAMGVVFVCASIGKLGMGFFSDRVSARVALTVNFIGAALGIALVFGAANRAMLAVFVLIFGLTLGAPLVLIPLLQADSMGLKVWIDRGNSRRLQYSGRGRGSVRGRAHL